MPVPAGLALLGWSEAAGVREKLLWAWPALEKAGISVLAEPPPSASENAACDFVTSAVLGTGGCAAFGASVLAEPPPRASENAACDFVTSAVLGTGG